MLSRRFFASPTTRWWYGAAVVVLSAWILHSFLEALLAASVTAVASWPLYQRFADRLRPRCGHSATALMFTVLITVFVLAPVVFAFGALLTEAHSLLLELAAADKRGFAIPWWLEHVPVAGSRLTELWASKLGHPDALSAWAQHADPAALLAFAQSLGRFMVRHLFIIGFTIVVVFFLYHDGAAIARDARLMLRHCLGERAERYLELATKAVHAAVNSMLVVALFDGLASGVAYAITGVPRSGMWAAITGALALIPFLGYAAIAALALHLSLTNAGGSAAVALGLGCVVLLCGDKIVRPMVAREGVGLSFAWALMGCLGGFEVLGLIGLVIGPVVLTLAREIWQQHVRDIELTDLARTRVPVGELTSPKPDPDVRVR